MNNPFSQKEGWLDKNYPKTTKIARTIFYSLLVLGIATTLHYVASLNSEETTTIYVDPTGEQPWELIGGEGERIYLRHGIIYAYKDNPDKEYNIVAFTLHVTSKQYERMDFFDTPEEAEAAGYKPSKYFAKDYECVKAGKDWLECHRDEYETQFRNEGGFSTDETSQLEYRCPSWNMLCEKIEQQKNVKWRVMTKEEY